MLVISQKDIFNAIISKHLKENNNISNVLTCYHQSRKPVNLKKKMENINVCCGLFKIGKKKIYNIFLST